MTRPEQTELYRWAAEQARQRAAEWRQSAEDYPKYREDALANAEAAENRARIYERNANGAA